MQKIIVAIDGYSGCGKSITAKLVAAKLGYSYVDTGAMYRAVTLYFCQNHISLTDPNAITKALEQIHITFVYNDKLGKSETYLNGLNVEEEIRKMYISGKVSQVSAIPQIRWAMVKQQQKMAHKRGVVMDGRDIGTRVFPDAELKIFMIADIEVRAKRRQEELLEKGEMIDLDDIVENLSSRDRIDTTRTEGPLVQAPDAHLLDTTNLTVEEQTELVVNMAISKMLENNVARSVSK